MRRLVAQAVGMYRGGFDSRRMLLTQALAAPAGGQGLSPFAALMQQNTRLVILTLEARPAPCPAARAARLRPAPYGFRACLRKLYLVGASRGAGGVSQALACVQPCWAARGHLSLSLPLPFRFLFRPGSAP
jgi:hypothetical protein